MFFNDNDTPSQSSTSPPETPGFQQMINPFPTSPDAFSPNFQRNLSFNTSFDSITRHSMQSRFDDDSWVTSHQESSEMSIQNLPNNNNSFDPFGNKRNMDQGVPFVDMDQGVPFVDIDQGVPFVDSTTSNDVGFSVFPSDAFNDDIFAGFSSSPTEQDFQVKDDPFADIPDWNSVASEEINNTVQTVNPFLEDEAHDQVLSEPLGNPFDNSLPITNNINEPAIDDGNPDIFSQYLSNVVASRDALSNTTPEHSASKVLSMDDLFGASPDFINNNNNISNSDESFFNVKFDDNFSNNTSFDAGFETRFSELTLKEKSGNPLNEFNENDDSFTFDNNTSQTNGIEQPTKTERSNSQVCSCIT